MLRRVIALLLLAAAPAAAQVQFRPSDAPSVVAANAPWYLSREPIQFAGDTYYPAGAAVFFDRNTMVRSGYYRGVPIYVDATIEPYSVMLVPVGRGLLQPYERVRRGEIASTTGSRTPSFPVRAVADAPVPLMGSSAPTVTGIPEPLRYAAVADDDAPTPRIAAVDAAAPPPSPPASPVRNEAGVVASLRGPDGNVGLWVLYAGQKWVSAGSAVPLRASQFRAVGKYAGFPVFMRTGVADTIYIPTRAGLVAPYRADR